MGPVPLVLDLRIAHERFGSSSEPRINGHLNYRHDLDRPLNEPVSDKIRQYHVDFNNRPSHPVDFMSSMTSTSVCLHGEFVCLLFLQTHRETDRFLATSEVRLS